MTGPIITGLTTEATTAPLLIEPWRTTQETETVVHELQGGASPWVSIATARTRSGTLSALYEDETSAEAARTLLSTAQLFETTYTDRPTLEFTFAVTGPIEVELTRTRRRWMVRFGYREVA